ncbi:MAG TPA: dihydrodipicolinate synthase family protein [Caldilineaceae bacterium]|nr:dihydrodipicolinate synthase family protein [Caldilineaceae bacterium]
MLTPNGVPSQATSQALRGIFVPTLTPVHADLSPDLDRWIDHSRRLLQMGCHGLCPFGTTSEANSFGLSERMEMLEALVAAGIPAAQLMPGTGTCAIPDTVRLTAHAVGLGCSGVLLLPPFYYKGVSDDGLFRSVAEVIERVGDARLRIYLYHIPPVAQVGFSLALIERLIDAYPGVVVGIKDSSGDWNNLQALLTRFPGFGIFTGSERFLLPTLRAGGAGSINAVANVIAPLQRRLYDQQDSPNAEALQEEINRLRQTYKDYPAIPSLKQIMAYLRRDPSWLHLRPPLTALSAEQAQTLIANLEASGVLAAQQG